MNACAYLPNRVSISIEETKWIVGTTIHGKTDIGDIVVGIGCGLRTSERTLVLRTTDIKLVVIRAECLQVLGFNLDGEVYIRAGEDFSGVDDCGSVLVAVHLVFDANGRFGDLDIFLVVVIKKRCVASDCKVGLRVIALGCHAGPEDDAVGVWVA